MAGALVILNFYAIVQETGLQALTRSPRKS
jgi:hypothetical protein